MTIREKIVSRRYAHTVSQIYRMLGWIFFVGKKYRCPCCCGSFRRLKRFGVISRPNACCPKCGSLERHRLLWLYLNDRTNLFTERLRLLHFAPEYCLYRSFKSMTNLDYTSADLDSPLAMLKVDIMAIPFPDHSFDVVLCNHVLEHVPDDRKAIGELLRVLKPGGWAILQSPVNTTCEKTFEYAGAVTAEVRKTLSGASDHLRIYGLDYRERLESAGFQVKVDGYVRELSPEVVGMCALDREEDIYYCTKPAG